MFILRDSDPWQLAASALTHLRWTLFKPIVLNPQLITWGHREVCLDSLKLYWVVKIIQDWWLSQSPWYRSSSAGSFCYKCAFWEDGHESLVCRKENWELAWLLYLGSWEYFIAIALFFFINAAQTCSLLGTMICGAFPLCIAWALTRLTVDVSVMIFLQQWQFREMFFKFVATDRHRWIPN